MLHGSEFWSFERRFGSETRGMTGNDQPQGGSDKMAAPGNRMINVDADIDNRPGWRLTMTGNYESKPRARRPGWIWVWAALVIYFALEVARLS
jgi:hypothetical protein